MYVHPPPHFLRRTPLFRIPPFCWVRPVGDPVATILITTHLSLVFVRRPLCIWNFPLQKNLVCLWCSEQKGHLRHIENADVLVTLASGMMETALPQVWVGLCGWGGEMGLSPQSLPSVSVPGHVSRLDGSTPHFVTRWHPRLPSPKRGALPMGTLDGWTITKPHYDFFPAFFSPTLKTESHWLVSGSLLFMTKQLCLSTLSFDRAVPWVTRQFIVYIGNFGKWWGGWGWFLVMSLRHKAAALPGQIGTDISLTPSGSYILGL